ncbi:type III secretion system stator protein SctL [Pseudomonas sp. MWU15-20650]|uniref:type III secretion system stator protein SctL n=1 Tax=Pseudomonas sp. MWU15-20650 TaxID=2933107 RepID=UPI00200BDA68|nr:type III secretion system stator protein SctL [Pseudomonas sp. MWU15-20650]
MLCLHKIELRTNATSLPFPLIPREVLTDVSKANQRLVSANAQADELIRRAEEKCKVLQEKATVEIWQRADEQLKCWEREREEILGNIEHYATLITNQAISCILDETIEPNRLAALIKKLLASQMPEINATLFCCPAEIEYVKQYLAIHGATRWQLQANDRTPPQTLVLKTDEGDFFINWNSMFETVLKHST